MLRTPLEKYVALISGMMVTSIDEVVIGPPSIPSNAPQKY